MNMLSPPPAVERGVRCWCGNAFLEDFSPDYWRCAECQTLVLQTMPGEEISQVRDDEHDFYGKNYYQRHVQEDYGLPDLATRARADLPERCLHWLKTLLKYVPGPGAHTLELGCGHGGFVAMQLWAGLDATGLELSPWLVQQAREWFGVPILQGRLEDQNLPPGSWDAVILMDVLEHLPDPRRTVQAAAVLLRSPESFLLIQTPCYPAGRSYEELCVENHPFLQMLKPQEHLYLFSEQSVARLCAEVGVGQIRFEPAIFAHYDLFAVASAGPLRDRSIPERTKMLMDALPPARWTQALLDLDEVRDNLSARLAASAADCAVLRRNAEDQHAESTRLHATLHDLWPKLEEGEHARNLAVAQKADLQKQFQLMKADNAARLDIIERQGAELGALRAELSLAGGELQSLRGHYERSEADRAARLEVIETQGKMVSKLHARIHAQDNEHVKLATDLDGSFKAQVALQAQLAAAENARGKLAADFDGMHEAHSVLQAQFVMTDRAREQLAIDLDELHKKHASLTKELSESYRKQRALENHWTSRLSRRLKLRPR